MSAVILPFPPRWVRAWLICAVDPGRFRAELHGIQTDGPQMTEPGPHWLVMDALRRPEVRQGLPIVPPWRARA
jgi:hypothetical protein